MVADMIIRADKCSTFGMKKAPAKSVLFFPKLIVNKTLIPTIGNEKSFCYLGRYFNYEITNNEHKLELVSLLTDPNEGNRSEAVTSEKQDSPLQSLRYLTIATIQLKTWISQNLETVFKQYIRK